MRLIIIATLATIIATPSTVNTPAVEWREHSNKHYSDGSSCQQVGLLPVSVKKC